MMATHKALTGYQVWGGVAWLLETMLCQSALLATIVLISFSMKHGKSEADVKSFSTSEESQCPQMPY